MNTKEPWGRERGDHLSAVSDVGKTCIGQVDGMNESMNDTQTLDMRCI